MNSERSKQLALWLGSILALLISMIILGGFTRLTESGLSMVDWRPITGWLPPLNEAAWEQVFADYRKSPEYLKTNVGMSNAEFRSIFWLEYLHRLLGRIIGVVFLVPMIVFIFRGWIKGALLIKVVGLFFLGGLQGVLGWYMVKSGLIDRPDVSQYRLAAHLGLALIILAAVLWVTLDLIKPRAVEVFGEGEVNKRFGRGALALLGLIFITILSGAFVAGLDAGHVYNTYPLMDGDFIPVGLWDLSPTLINIFENIITVQFDHRILAIIVVISVAIFYWRTRQVRLTISQRLSTHALLAAACFQVFLGIFTLLLVVPISLAAMHQLGGVILLATTIWLAHEFRPVQTP
jgi:cytochrome c oxidase assembly protein subunit 15